MATSAERGPERGVESVEALIGHTVVAEPSAPPQWNRSEARAAKSAPLRIYLGAAPGVGKTYAMLSEGRVAPSAGAEVVVGVVETYGRPRTPRCSQGPRDRRRAHDRVPRRHLRGDGHRRGASQRHPEVALVDELAHTNVPGARRAKRWEDVLDLLADGIEVITTVNVQHLESLNDVVADVTGIQQRETVPDWVLDLADQVELVDMSPHALQRRMMHGNVYPDRARRSSRCGASSPTENLTALRELALMRVANQVDEELLSRWSKGRTPETRERVLVCVVASRSSPTTSSGGARRIAQRARRRPAGGPRRANRDEPRGDRVARESSTDGRPRRRASRSSTTTDPVDGRRYVAYASTSRRSSSASHCRSRWKEILRGSFVNRLIRQASNIDIHVIAQRDAVIPRGPRPRTIRFALDAVAGEQHPVTRSSTTSSPSVDRADEERVERRRGARARVSSACSTPSTAVDVTGQPTVITTTAIDPATSPGIEPWRLASTWRPIDEDGALQGGGHAVAPPPAARG